jgi:hypothetical protein
MMTANGVAPSWVAAATVWAVIDGEGNPAESADTAHTGAFAP